MNDAKIIAVIITAITSLLIAIFSYFTGRKNERQILRLKSELDEQKAVKDARRDYEYEARKRLYQECEPLLFQLAELSENALYRIYSLARTARLGNLGPDGTGWLSSYGYYFRSTVYNLLAPLTIFKLLQRRLTMIDLTVEPHIQTQYELMKHLYFSFTVAFELASRRPTLEYHPDVDDLEKKIEEDPKVYWRQGLAIGRLDNAVESLIKIDSNKVERCISFGEFELQFLSKNSELEEHWQKVCEIFLDFHPETRPVLWRILITQVHLYHTLIQSQWNRDISNVESYSNLLKVPKSVYDHCKWRESTGKEDEKEMMEPFKVAESYLRDNLKYIFEKRVL